MRFLLALALVVVVGFAASAQAPTPQQLQAELLRVSVSLAEANRKIAELEALRWEAALCLPTGQRWNWQTLTVQPTSP